MRLTWRNGFVPVPLVILTVYLHFTSTHELEPTGANTEYLGFVYSPTIDSRPRPLLLTKVRSPRNHLGRPDPPLHKLEPVTSSSDGHAQYVRSHNHESYGSPPRPVASPRHQQSKPPLILKISNIKSELTKPLPPPPPFYAPSPDFESSRSKTGRRAVAHRAPERCRRQVKTSNQTSGKLETLAGQKIQTADQTQDGSDDTYWKVSSPVIAFDNYEDEKINTSDHDAGEQRFFPSFPSTNPYLGINPYITATSGGRPTVFPGSSRTLPPRPQFGQKYSHSQRGPSGVYTAESSDRYVDSNILGSGNFEVVRGGTFYEDDENYHPGFASPHQPHPTAEEGSDYYHHNGHSSPSPFGQPGSDFFANFRDFADINPGHSRAFSHNHETRLDPYNTTPADEHAEDILNKMQSRMDITNSENKNKEDPMMATY